MCEILTSNAGKVSLQIDKFLTQPSFAKPRSSNGWGLVAMVITQRGVPGQIARGSWVTLG